MNMKKVKEKLSSPWIAFALNLLLLIVFLALVTVHIKMTIDVAPVFKSDDPLPRGDPDQKPATIDSETQTVDEPRNVCESPECITLAHELVSAIFFVNFNVLFHGFSTTTKTRQWIRVRISINISVGNSMSIRQSVKAEWPLNVLHFPS